MFLPLLPTQNPRGNVARSPHHRPRAFGSGLLSVNVLAMSIAFARPATAQGNDAASLAQALQNPIADMISLPFQYSINLDNGPLYKPQHILNTQPVYPVKLRADWNLITRTILRLISQPAFTPQ